MNPVQAEKNKKP